jgi:NAD(P)-dependent dehydrogenase (short-subunit alcohol dehydrogenase family)
MTFNPMNLSGRGFLVTGGSSGLGRATAILLSRLGGKVMVLGRNVERLQETVAALEPGGHGYHVFDLEQADAIPEMMSELAAGFGPLSGMVHCAGIVQMKPLMVARACDYTSLYQVHVVAPAQMLRGLTRRGVAVAEGCSAVLVGSVVTSVGAAGLSAYSSAKSALGGLVRSAALELARYRIRVNAVLPGEFASDLSGLGRQALTAAQAAKVEQMQPLGPGCAEDVAGAVAFLLADTARWITGSLLVVDGGYLAQ